MEEETSKDIASFNNAAEYCASLTVEERHIADAISSKDYAKWNDLLDILWTDLYEWFDEDGVVEQDDIRKKQKEAWERINKAIKNRKTSVDTKDVELFFMRTIMLKKVLHKVGLRMMKTDDQSNVSILSRKPRMNYR